MRGIGRVAGRGDGRAVERLTFEGRLGAVVARFEDAIPAGCGLAPAASEGSVVGRSGRSPMGRSGSTTTTGG